MINKFFQFLGLVKRAGKAIEGYNKCEDSLGKKKIHLFIFSNDLSERSYKLFSTYCIKENIPFIDEFSKEDLGMAIGRVEINVIGITDKNMADKLLINYKENKNNKI